MAASKITLDHLKSVLGEEGLAEGRDYTVSADEKGNLQLTVQVAPNSFYLPEELLAHDPSEVEILHALTVGSGSKRTRDGIRFELAVKSFRRTVYADEGLTAFLADPRAEGGDRFKDRGEDIWKRIEGEVALEGFEERLRTDFY